MNSISTTNTTSTEGKVPATPSTSTAPSTTSMTATTGTTPAILPTDYLVGGYYRGEGKGRYVDPALIDQAEAIGTALAADGVKPAVLNRMIKTLKTAARLPYAAQQGALKKLSPQVLDLEHKKKAPPMLRELVERNQATVQNEADYAACLDHFRDIVVYLTVAQT